MALNQKAGSKKNMNSDHLENLTRQQLKELEEKEKSFVQKILDVVISLLPIICGIAAILEYQLIPDGSSNNDPKTYLGLLIVLIAAYVLYGAVGVIRRLRGDKTIIERVRYKAPLYSALFLLLLAYDYLTLKTGILTQPFVPCMNSILNAAWNDDRAALIRVKAVERMQVQNDRRQFQRKTGKQCRKSRLLEQS